ncbi:MAG: hypothetical protein JW993_14880 [Sedimentisphaerales bacterium]|nr:hypothetical protein [Sedimentisphaerales bacterium]
MKSLPICLCTVVALLSGCEHHVEKEFASYGDSVVVTDSRWEREVDIAVVEVHRVLANWQVDPNGARSDPTYQAGSRKIDNSQGTECTISRLEFTNHNGRNTLQTICIPDRDMILVLCEAPTNAATLTLRNQLATILTARGFRHRD